MERMKHTDDCFLTMWADTLSKRRKVNNEWLTQGPEKKTLNMSMFVRQCESRTEYEGKNINF